MTHHNKAMFGLLKAVDSGKGLTVEGWANRAVVDRGGDIIPKSAWQLDNFKKNAIILWNHDKSKPIGKAQVIEAKDEGLYVKARLSSSADPEISKIRDLVKEGVLNAFSVGFDLIDAQSTDKGVTEIKAAELFEISIVSLPMNQDSLFTVAKSYDYDEAKSLTARGLDDVLSAPAPEAAPAATEKASDEAPVDATPADGAADAVETVDAAPVEKKEIEFEVQAIKYPKADYASQEEAAAKAEADGWLVGLPSETDAEWVFTQAPPDEFVSLQDLVLDSGATAVVGQCKPEDPAATDKSAETSESDEEQKALDDADEKQAMPTLPLPTDAPEVELPEALLQARQTNVMLGQVVAELQAVRQALADLAHAMPAKQVSPPVDVAPPQVVPPQPAQMTAQDHVAKDTEIVRQYLEEITKTLDRIGA